MELSKNKEKYIRSLQQKKYRQKYNKFVVEGDKMVTEILKQGIRPQWLAGTPQWIEHHADLCAPEFTLTASENQLRQLSALVNTSGVLAVVDLPDMVMALRPGWTIYLDDLQDPGNAGTIIRLADWFGVTQVVFSSHSVDPFNAKVVQSSMGSVLRVPIGRMDFSTLRQKLPQADIYAADMEGHSVLDLRKKPGAGVLVIGNEGQGLSDDVREQVTRFLSIPKSVGSQAESLNAAMACGIILALIAGGR